MKEEVKGLVYENDAGWVQKVGTGHFVVYKKGACGSTKCGTFHFPRNGVEAKLRAISHCDKLERP